MSVDERKIKDLAEELHTMMCKSNHIDQCGWEYGEDTWTRKKYIELAKELAVIVGAGAAITVIRKLREMCW